MPVRSCLAQNIRLATLRPQSGTTASHLAGYDDSAATGPIGRPRTTAVWKTPAPVAAYDQNAVI